jgi:hypothetical protein
METGDSFMVATSWLPPLIRKVDFDNDMTAYIEAIYARFRQDFIDMRPEFRGIRLGLKRHPEQGGKEATFWHLVTEGEREDARTLAMDRCERIGWPAPVIRHSEDEEIRCWKNRRGSETRILLWLVPDDYLVVLNEREGYILPWTAYPLTYGNTKRKLEKEYEAFKKARGSPL